MQQRLLRDARRECSRALERRSLTGWRNAAASVSAGTPTPTAIVERNGEGENWAACGQEIPRQPNCRTPRYRVTGRSTDDGRANVIVQSDVATH